MKPLRLALVLLALATTAGAFPLIDRTGGPCSEDALSPAIAARANDGLLAWCDQSTQRMRGILVGPTGAPLMDSSFVIGPTSRCSVPTIATDGRDFLVSWVIDGRLTVAYVAEGTHVESISSTTDNAFDAKLTFTGTDYLLLLRSPTEAHVALLDRRGNISRTVTVTTSVQAVTSVAIATTPPNAFAFWVDALDNQVHGLDVSPERIRSGTFVPAAPIQAQPNAGANIIGPVIAVAGANSYLILWTEPPDVSQQNNMKLNFRALSATGQPLSQRASVTIDAVDRQPVVFWNGTSFTVLYSAQRSTVWSILTVRVSAEGQLLDPAPISIGVLPMFNRAKAAAKIGPNAVVAFERYRTAAPTTVAELFTLAVTPAPSLTGDEGGTIVSRALPAEDEPRAVWTGDDWVVAWRERRNIGRILVSRIGPDGTRVDPKGIALDPIRPDEAAQTDPAIASSGAEAFVVWTDASGLFDGIIRGALIENARSGTLDPEAISISFDATSNSAPDVVWDGEEYVVVWTNKTGQLVAVRINRVGRIIDPFPVQLNESGLHPRIAARGDELLVVWQEQVVAPPPTPVPFTTFYGYNLLAQRFTRALFPVASRITLTSGGNLGNEAKGHSVAADPNGYLITWTQSSRTSPTVLTAFSLADFGRTIPLGFAGTGPTTVTWNGTAYLVGHARQVLTVTPAGTVLSRLTALPDGRDAAAISAGGIAPLLLATSLDNEGVVQIDAFLLTPARRRPR